MVLCTNQQENIDFGIILLRHPTLFKKMVTLLYLYFIHVNKFTTWT